MKTSILIFLLAITIICIMNTYQMTTQSKSTNVTSPLSPSTPIATSTPTPLPSPSPILFNRETNLQSELDSINPEIKSDDFTELEELIQTL